jgi:hypothetical protein
MILLVEWFKILIQMYFIDYEGVTQDLIDWCHSFLMRRLYIQKLAWVMGVVKLVIHLHVKHFLFLNSNIGFIIIIAIHILILLNFS